jgi:hypothetical protein
VSANVTSLQRLREAKNVLDMAKDELSRHERRGNPEHLGYHPTLNELRGRVARAALNVRWIMEGSREAC